MPEQEIDLSGVGETRTYSAHTEGLAEYGIKRGHVTREPGSLFASVRSLSSETTWHPAATVEGSGVVGVTCDCPNGKKGGIRARCWHAAALEHLLEEEEDHPQA